MWRREKGKVPALMLHSRGGDTSRQISIFVSNITYEENKSDELDSDGWNACEKGPLAGVVEEVPYLGSSRGTVFQVLVPAALEALKLGRLGIREAGVLERCE